MTTRVPTKADEEIIKCLNERRCFSMLAGAGSGKTTSLVESLKALLKMEGPRMLRDGQRVVCITYTKRATEVISNRLRQNPLFVVSTLHSFLWGEIRHFSNSIRESLRLCVLPGHIEKLQEKDNGGISQKARDARAKILDLQHALANLDSVHVFRYGDDTPFSNYLRGEIGHDDLVLIAADMIQTRAPFRRILGQKYPYYFVDEAQDTSPDIVTALNALCADEGLPVVGYFGDPMQQIYDKGMGDFAGPPGATTITKDENFRSAPEVITLLNAFRRDVEQYPAGANKSMTGSVGITLVKAEIPAAPRGRYSDEQLERATQRLAEAVKAWGWTQRHTAKQLFLVRRMIARRLGFLPLHDLFTGPYASTRAQNAYEEGEHYLVKPLVETIVPLVRAHREGRSGAVMRVLTGRTVAFRPAGAHTEKTIRDVRKIANVVTTHLAKMFASKNLGDVVRYCRDQELISASERLSRDLDRPPREEDYDDEKHAEEKSDWLADAFFGMRCVEFENYCSFLDENTPYSTQHGVKGEEYADVIVVFDDVEASWNNYSFAKLLTPESAGEPGDGQKERSRKLAYVCFSRTINNLRILLFTPDPESSARELTAQGFFQESQISKLS